LKEYGGNAWPPAKRQTHDRQQVAAATEEA
jgi:hypothetical protein